METFFRAIQTLQQRLNEAGIPSVVIGGVALGTWGNPRLTRDVGLKVLLTREDADRLLSVLSPDYVSLLPNPQLVLRQQALLFVTDQNGVRFDLLLAETTYDHEAVCRGREIEAAPGITIRLCSPEDLIIYKMISTRARDYEDAMSVVHRQGDALDDRYVIKWLRQFELALDDSTLVTQYQQWRHQQGRSVR